MAIQQHTSALITRAQSLLDRVVSSSTRSQFYSNVQTFAIEQPFLASFLFLQLAFSATPLLIFLSFASGLLLLSLVSAVLFSLFWIGVALLVLVPTLFVTVSLAVGIWVWAVASFVVVRWVYGMLPAGRKEVGLANGGGNGKKIVLEKKGEAYGDSKVEVVGDA